MKLLTLADYEASPNLQVGISPEIENKLVNECIEYTTCMCEQLRVSTDIMQTALTILHFYLKRKPFTELDRFLLSTSCTYLACKIDYKHLSLQSVAEYFFNNRKGCKKARRGNQEIMDALFVEISK